ncbi:hypothetical protein V8F06_009267 [Rhypophila decipiens]
MAILSLPNELLNMILFPHEGIPTKTDLAYLFNTASTCKRFREIIIPTLYRHLGGRLDPGNEGWWEEKAINCLIRTLTENPHLRSLVRSLSYTECWANRDGWHLSHIYDRVLLALLSLSKGNLTRAVLGIPRANQKSGNEVGPIRDWIEHVDDGVSFCRFPILEKLRHLTLCGEVSGVDRSRICCIHALLSKTPNIESLDLVKVPLPPDIHYPGSLQSLTLENCRLLRVDRHNGPCDFPGSLIQLCDRLICLRVDPRGPTYELESAADKGLSLFPRKLLCRYETSEWDPQISALIDEEVSDIWCTPPDRNPGEIKTDPVTKAVIKIIQSASTNLERIHWGVPRIGYFDKSSPRIGSPLKLAKLKTISIHCSNLRLVDVNGRYASNLLRATFEGCARLEVIELVWDGFFDYVENRAIGFALSKFADAVVEEKGKGNTFNSLKELILVPHWKGEVCRLLGNRSLFNLKSVMKVSVMESTLDCDGLGERVLRKR